MNPSQAGVDVSHYQGAIDWDALYGNTAFVLSKATEGTNVVDPQFVNNRDGARRVGMPTGFYHFARALNADAEAQNFYNNLGALVPGEWLILDWEVQYADPVGWCLNFFQAIKDLTLSQTSGVLYLNKSTFNGYNWQPVLDFGVQIWLAAPSDPAGTAGLISYPYIAQQYGYTTVSGITGNVDADYYEHSMSTFKDWGYIPPVAPTPSTPAAPTPVKTIPTQTPTAPTPKPVKDVGVTATKSQVKKNFLSQAWDKILRFLDIRI